MFFGKKTPPKNPHNLMLDNGELVAVHLKHHPRAKRMKLRVSRSNSQVTLTLPPKTPTKLMEAFLEDSKAWIMAELTNALTPINVDARASLPVQGEMHQVTASPDRKRGIAINDGMITIPADDLDLAGSRIKRGLMNFAKKKISDTTYYYSELMGVDYKSISIGDMKTRWGSCSTAGDLKFNFRLIMGPTYLLDYVVVHELAHRTHMDHSKAFWQRVEDFYPDYKQAKKDLQHWSPKLQRYQF